MENENQVTEHRDNHGRSVFAGVVVGGLAGAITALLLAPQSGKDTRKQIQNKAVELRSRTGDAMEDAVEQVRTKADEIKSGVRSKANELKSQGQAVLVEQLDRVSAAAEARKKDIQARGN